MTILDTFILPILLGLLGFIEPCSLGANYIFLAYLKRMEVQRRLLESIIFTLSRGVFLGLVGMSIAWFGRWILGFQKLYLFFLGIVFLLVGLTYLLGGKLFVSKFDVGLNRLVGWKVRGGIGLGIVFGLSAPACATPLILLLLTKGLLEGMVGGFVSLFIFGIALSLPLVGIAFSSRGSSLLNRLSFSSKWTPYVTGVVLSLVGIYGIVSGISK